jgi:hypothetical protein
MLASNMPTSNGKAQHDVFAHRVGPDKNHREKIIASLPNFP